jgi:hypothetical protein
VVPFLGLNNRIKTLSVISSSPSLVVCRVMILGCVSLILHCNSPLVKTTSFKSAEPGII